MLQHEKNQQRNLVIPGNALEVSSPVGSIPLPFDTFLRSLSEELRHRVFNNALFLFSRKKVKISWNVGSLTMVTDRGGTVDFGW